MRALGDFRKPTLAAINGTAIGIGVTVLLHCDFAYAVPGAHMALPFVNLALVPEFASSLLLTRLVGARRAQELLLTGDAFTSEQAVADGLINGIIPADQLLNEVEKKARALAAKAPGAVRKTRELIRADLAAIHAHMDLENKAFGERLATPELKEAITAFYEKRHPDYSKFE
jgi:enoyl-CoA hydratase/carnithine racemase